VEDDTVLAQRQYYSETAEDYDTRHLLTPGEHSLALGWLSALIRANGFGGVLDVGCGTGRCLRFLKREGLQIALKGIEPVEALRDVGMRKGLSAGEIIDGDALALPFADGSIDLVCSFGVLHHVPDHEKAVAEMCRVARKAVFISDSNNFGQGSATARAIKQGLRALGLWPMVKFVQTKGKVYQFSEEDGIYFSYSVLDDTPVLRRRFSELYFMGTHSSGPNLYRTASHLAVFAQRPWVGS
jgi:ubiquinone/menaquinone biosynthesis C-methylase UbiE